MCKRTEFSFANNLDLIIGEMLTVLIQAIGLQRNMVNAFSMLLNIVKYDTATIKGFHQFETDRAITNGYQGRNLMPVRIGFSGKLFGVHCLLHKL